MNNLKTDSLIDMHTHTCYSDGEFTPNELIKRAIKNNVGTLAITDHDTILGVKNVVYDDWMDELDFIPGIELSAKVDKGRMHILGYGIDVNNTQLNDKMDELKDNSLHSVLSIMEQLKKDYGIRFHYDDIKELINSNHNLGRPDLAKLCIKYGYANSVEEAFDKYLIDAYNKIRKNKKGLSYEECIDLILKSGGIPVLAHPKTLELTEKELLIMIKELISCGLQGIEVYHSSHSKDQTNQYLDIANQYDLLISGGSDFHGITVKPDIDVGTGKNGNIMIKELSLLNHIRGNRK